MSSTLGPYGTNTHTAVNQFACPAGSYITGVNGKAGDDVDAITGVSCKNIVTGASTTPAGSAPLGDSSGGGGKSFICNQSGQGDGLWGWQVRAQTEVEGLNGWCAPAFPGGASPSVGSTNQYRAGQWGNQSAMTNSYCPNGWLVQSLSGATSLHDKYLTDFTFTCRNFNSMASISTHPLACCAGTDTSQECQEVKPFLDCGNVLAAHCSVGDNIFSDLTCAAAVTNGAISANDANTMKVQWCYTGNNFSSTSCQNLCTYNTGADTGATISSSTATGGTTNLKRSCNTLYAAACSNSVNQQLYGNGICSCQLPWESYPGAGVIDQIKNAPQEPGCYFHQCREEGYLKQPIAALDCPKCVQNLVVNMQNTTDSTISNIAQSCNVSSSTGTATAAPVTTAPATPMPTVAPVAYAGVSAITKTWYVWVVVVLLILCLCSALGIGLAMF